MTQHSENSSYRENLIEHLFVTELLKMSWLHHRCSLEVAKPEVDNSGYDLIAETMGLVRHIQLKTSIVGGTTASQKIHTKLAEKPSGCVVWIYFDEKPCVSALSFISGQKRESRCQASSSARLRSTRKAIKMVSKQSVRISGCYPKVASKQLSQLKVSTLNCSKWHNPAVERHGPQAALAGSLRASRSGRLSPPR